MGITPGALAEIEKKKKTVEQIILDPNIFIKDFPVDPWTPYIHTNNFIQQGVNRLLGYDSAEGRWRRLACSTDGWLLGVNLIKGYYLNTEPDAFTSDVVSDIRVNSRKILMVDHADHEMDQYMVFDAVSVPGTSLVVHEGIDVSGYHKISVLVSTTQNCTVYIQGSDDNTNFYDLKSDADADLTWNCNNEKIWFRVLPATRYFRVAVYNSVAVAATVTGVVHGQA